LQGFTVEDVVKGGGATVDEWCVYLSDGTLPTRAKPVIERESQPAKEYKAVKSPLGHATLQTVFKSENGCTRVELANALRIHLKSVNGVVGGHVARGWLKPSDNGRFLITEKGVQAFERVSQ
jgi:hypothetical protein